VLEHLESRREDYLEGFGQGEVEWALQCARVVKQGSEVWLDAGRTRDGSMADNVDWILDHSPPGTKVVLWAHNAHVSRDPTYGSMGSDLAERHGDDLCVLGFLFHEGKYTAVGSDGLGTYGTMTSEPGSVEWALKEVGIPSLMLDLRHTKVDSSAGTWLAEELDYRTIGAMAVEWAFTRGVVADMFDVLVFFEQSHPTIPVQDGR
jgi:erythromycin esterase